MTGIEAKAAQISNQHGLAVDESAPAGDTARADHPIAFKRNDRSMSWSIDRGRSIEVAGFSLERQMDEPGHRVLAQQATKRRVVLARGNLKPHCALGASRLFGNQLASSSGRFHP